MLAAQELQTNGAVDPFWGPVGELMAQVPLFSRLLGQERLIGHEDAVNLARLGKCGIIGILS